MVRPGTSIARGDAAQVNAVMSDAAASDDSDLRNIVHAGTTLVATGLRSPSGRMLEVGTS